MKILNLKLIIIVFMLIFNVACATQWRDSRTGEIRDTVPIYQDCKKSVPEYVKDESCWYNCMDYYYKKNGTSNPAACDQQCIKATGKNLLVDDYDCNCRRAKQDGWIHEDK